MPTFCVLGMVSAFSSLAGAAASARFSLVEAAELLFSSASSSCSSLRGQWGLRGAQGARADLRARASDTAWGRERGGTK